MKKNELLELLPILQAYVEGKELQRRKHNHPACQSDHTRFYNPPGPWVDYMPGDEVDLNPWMYEYRVKPDPRPFKDMEECWKEMQKHHPLGWLKDLRNDSIINIIQVDDNGVSYINDDYITENYPMMLKSFKFTDGKPFGIYE
jgi:hypothetical protein